MAQEKPTILLVEDSQQLRWTISMHFRALGWRVLRARSTEAALAAAGRRKVDAVLVDEDLAAGPGGDPAGVLRRRIKAPVLIVAGPEPRLDFLEAEILRLLSR